jgi:hypothetical protein
LDDTFQQTVTVEQPHLPSEAKRRVLDCVVSAFSSTVGRRAGEAVFWNLSRDDIAERPDQLIESLEIMFGGGSASIIEDAMTKALRKEFGLVSSIDGEGFICVISRATRPIG